MGLLFWKSPKVIVFALLYAARELAYTTYHKGESPTPPADDKTLNTRVDAALAKPPRLAKPRTDHP